MTKRKESITKRTVAKEKFDKALEQLKANSNVVSENIYPSITLLDIALDIATDEVFGNARKARVLDKIDPDGEAEMRLIQLLETVKTSCRYTDEAIARNGLEIE